MEQVVGLHVHDDIQVAGRSARRAVLAFAVQPETLAVGNARRNPHGDAPVARGPAGAPARGAGIANDLAGSAALTARAGDDEKSLLVAQLSASRALGARLASRARGGTRALARLAVLLARNLDRRFRAGVGRLEFDLQIESQIDASGRAASPAASAAKSEEVTEDVGEVRGLEAWTVALRGARDARVAEPVVARAFVRIAQDAVRGRGFLEPFLGGLVPGIAVWMACWSASFR